MSSKTSFQEISGPTSWGRAVSGVREKGRFYWGINASGPFLHAPLGDSSSGVTQVWELHNSLGGLDQALFFNRKMLPQESRHGKRWRRLSTGMGRRCLEDLPLSRCRSARNGKRETKLRRRIQRRKEVRCRTRRGAKQNVLRGGNHTTNTKV